ncbi:MAG: bifunctional metallophosphatase/5'-nucleotidase [Coriobacteriales bacterium]|jgi:5'-nucleotidase|nr:bifunctional metallophosphatase/5'-nucleotidase [Coriobacteriales bacterium]
MENRHGVFRPQTRSSLLLSGWRSGWHSGWHSGWLSVLLSVLLTVLLAASLLLTGCAADSDSTTTIPLSGRIAIIHTNDIHGYALQVEATDSAPGSMGLAAVAQLKKDYEAQGYQVLLLDDGDATQDNVLVNLSKGESAIDFLNSAGYDAMSLGNHEFDWGVDQLETLTSKADFPVLAANIIVQATGKPFARPNQIFEMEGGAKIGVFGLATPETQTKSAPKNTAGLNILAGAELYQCAQEQVDELRARGCALVICLGHLGSSSSSPNSSLDVLDNTEGIDLFIDGHDHRVVSETVGNSLLVSTGAHLESIGLVVYENGMLTDKMLTYGSYNGFDPTTKALIDKVNAEVIAQLSEVIGTTLVPLNGEREPGVRTEETNLGDFAADALLWQASQTTNDTVDAAIVNGGGIRASLGVGDISMQTMLTVFPYHNALNVVTLKGSELLEVLEAATYSLPAAAGSFPQVAGITYCVDTAVPYQNGRQYPDSTFFAPGAPGARVTISEVGGRDFSLDGVYVVAMPGFLTYGGDTYYAVAKIYQDTGYSTGYSDTDALINFIQTALGGTIGEEYRLPHGRITVL